MFVEQKLKEADVELVELMTPASHFVPYVKTGNIVFVSGQLPPTVNGEMPKGKVGREFDTVQAKAIARDTGRVLLSVLKEVTGNLDKVERIVSVNGFVNSTDDYKEQPAVINGASELLCEVFGERGKHARFAISVNSLPFGVPLEIAMVAQVAD
jgi:enamine deaminase RidA (YjgF/YER057c/UK114 family)